MDRGASQATVHGVAKSWSQLSNTRMILKAVGPQYWCQAIADTDSAKGPASSLLWLSTE